MKRTNDEIMKDFLDLTCALSPENLSCDGELNPSEIAKKFKSLTQSWGKLEEEIGYKVTEDNAWDWHTQQQSKLRQKGNKNLFGV